MRRRATMIARPSTSIPEPMRTASATVVTRAWSWVAPPAGRIPGVTAKNGAGCAMRRM